MDIKSSCVLGNYLCIDTKCSCVCPGFTYVCINAKSSCVPNIYLCTCIDSNCSCVPNTYIYKLTLRVHLCPWFIYACIGTNWFLCPRITYVDGHQVFMCAHDLPTWTETWSGMRSLVNPWHNSSPDCMMPLTTSERNTTKWCLQRSRLFNRVIYRWKIGTLTQKINQI